MSLKWTRQIFANGMALYQESNHGKLHSVAFEGRQLHGAELWYPTHEKELLAIKDAHLKWRSYVDNGLPITVITDHDSLKYMNTMKNPSKRLTRWIDELQQYNLQIHYRAGKQVVVPDALSRCPDHVVLNAIMLGRGMENPLYLNSISGRERQEDYIVEGRHVEQTQQDQSLFHLKEAKLC